MGFEQSSMCNKVVYALTKLPIFHIPSLGQMNIESDDVQNSARMQDILKLPTNDSSGYFK